MHTVKATLLNRTNREGLAYGVQSALVSRCRQILNCGNRLARRVRIREYYRTHNRVCIQFGCGPSPLPGFLNTDLFGSIPVDITKPLPFVSESADLLYSNHLIEHVYSYQFKHFLAESLRVLKPDGMHIIATPSLERLAALMYGADDSDGRTTLLQFHENMMSEPLTPAIFINRMTHVNYGHHFVYDLASLSFLATQAGYATVAKVGNRQVPDDVIREYVATKGEAWNLETETFVLLKTASGVSRWLEQ